MWATPKNNYFMQTKKKSIGDVILNCMYKIGVTPDGGIGEQKSRGGPSYQFKTEERGNQKGVFYVPPFIFFFFGVLSA